MRPRHMWAIQSRWAWLVVLIWSSWPLVATHAGESQAIDPGGAKPVPDGQTNPSPRVRPAPPGSQQHVEARERMTLNQIAKPWDGRTPVKDQTVLSAIRTVPRHAFVLPEHIRMAYEDTPLPIGHGQTISQPYIVALMTELLALTPASKVLEIGTGSGYQAAVLAHLTEHVYSVEIIQPLAQQAAEVFAQQGYDEIQHHCADGYFGWQAESPFDAIIVTCASGHLPPALWDQLKPGGRIVIPIGGPHELQRLVVVTKTIDGKRRSRTVTFVRFVPLTRRDTTTP